jgi:hypothetical protein
MAMSKWLLVVLLVSGCDWGGALENACQQRGCTDGGAEDAGAVSGTSFSHPVRGLGALVSPNASAGRDWEVFLADTTFVGCTTPAAFHQVTVVTLSSPTLSLASTYDLDTQATSAQVRSYVDGGVVATAVRGTVTVVSSGPVGITGSFNATMAPEGGGPMTPLAGHFTAPVSCGP